jgi:hypothetical protein
MPKIKPKRRYRVLLWSWRLTYMSALAGAGYVAYGIYEMRTPSDQPEPDPSKKTLVILGLSNPRCCIRRTRVDTLQELAGVLSPC